MEPVSSLPHSQAPAPLSVLSQINPVYASYQTSIPSPKLCKMFGNMVISHGEELLELPPSWRPTFVGCMRLLIYYIRSCPPTEATTVNINLINNTN